MAFAAGTFRRCQNSQERTDPVGGVGKGGNVMHLLCLQGREMLQESNSPDLEPLLLALGVVCFESH